MGNYLPGINREIKGELECETLAVNILSNIFSPRMKRELLTSCFFLFFFRFDGKKVNGTVFIKQFV